MTTVTVKGDKAVTKALQAAGAASRKAIKASVREIGRRAAEDVRHQLPRRFTFRGTLPQFQRAILDTSGPKGSRYEASVKVGSSSSTTATGKLGRMLARQEEAEVSNSARPVFQNGVFRGLVGHTVPAPGLRTDKENPPKRLYPVNIGVNIRAWRNRRDGTDRVGLAKSARRVRVNGVRQSESFFVIQNAKGGTIMQRINGKSARPIWFVRRSIKRGARTEFVKSVTESALKHVDGVLSSAADTIAKAG